MTDREEYINLLASVSRPGIEGLIEYLDTTDFYTAPRSAKYHSNCKGGLCKHSLNVYKNLELLNKEYVEKATSKLIDTNSFGRETNESQGYGYQFWRCYDNSFFFNGMGGQLGICVPDKDMIMIYNSDNQGNGYAKEIIIKNSYKNEIIFTAKQLVEPFVKGNDSRGNSGTGLGLSIAKSIMDMHKFI